MQESSGLPIQKFIGKRVKELRNIKGYSQEKLALEAGLDRTYINSVENGRRNISINSLSKIAVAVDVSLQEFFNCGYFRSKE